MLQQVYREVLEALTPNAMDAPVVDAPDLAYQKYQHAMAPIAETSTEEM
jgi:hypothetical protein